MKRKLLSWVAILLVPALAWAQERPEQKGDEKLWEYLNRVAPLEKEAPVSTEQRVAPASLGFSEEARGATAEAGKKVLTSTAITEQAVSPMGTAVASSFADRVSNTLQNFVPLFQGAISGIDTSDDKRTVTLRLNPIRRPTFGELGLSASATEPKPYEALLDLLPDDIRPGQEEVIQKGLDDFTDLSFAATYNYVRKLEKDHLTSGRRWFFGRNPRLYEEVFAQFVGDAFTRVSNAALDPFFDKFEGTENFENFTRQELETRLGAADYQKLVGIMVERRELQAMLNGVATERATLFGQLVANQPQASLSATYHDRDPLVGRNETSVNLSIEMPAAPNINELLRSWRSKGGDWQAALDDLEKRTKEIEAGTKWSIVASWKEADRYRGSYQPTTEGASLVSLDNPRSHELSIKGQYTRNATWQRLNIEGIETFPMLHVAAEVIDVSDDSDRQNRRVLTVTYDVPVRKGVSFPVSLVYANKPEFLSDTDHQFSAHFGMSLNSLFGDQGN